MKKTPISLPTELLAAYTALALQQKRARAEIVREALQAYIDMPARTVPDWVGMIDTDGEFDSRNVKDWLRENWNPE